MSSPISMNSNSGTVCAGTGRVAVPDREVIDVGKRDLIDMDQW